MARVTFKDIKAGKTFYLAYFSLDENGDGRTPWNIQVIQIASRPYKFVASKIRCQGKPDASWVFKIQGIPILKSDGDGNTRTAYCSDYDIAAPGELLLSKVVWKELYTTRREAKKAQERHRCFYKASEEKIQELARWNLFKPLTNFA